MSQLRRPFPVIAFVYRDGDGVRNVLFIRCMLSADINFSQRDGKVVLIKLGEVLPLATYYLVTGVGGLDFVPVEINCCFGWFRLRCHPAWAESLLSSSNDHQLNDIHLSTPCIVVLASPDLRMPPSEYD